MAQIESSWKQFDIDQWSDSEAANIVHQWTNGVYF